MREKPRIGVFVCHCGLNIAKTVNVREVCEYARSLPNVVYVTDIEFTCSEEGQKKIKDAIKNHNLNRVVVAACSPKLHELTFRRCISEAGLNPFLLEMVNIREHVSWAHLNQPAEATEKAKHLVNAGVKRASKLEEIGFTTVPVKPSILVIGGGIAGITVSQKLAEYGFKVYLIERSPTLGGKALQLGRVFPTEDCGVCVTPINMELHRKCMYKARVDLSDNVEAYTLAELDSLEGYVGNFKARIKVKPRYVDSSLCINCGKCVEVCPIEVDNEYDFGISRRKAIYKPFTQSIPNSYVIDSANCSRCGRCVEVCPTKAIDLSQVEEERVFEVGAVVVAAGFEEFKPTGLYGFGEYRNVVTQMMLARMLDPSGPTSGKVVMLEGGGEPKRIVMIQCVGSRDPQTNIYCSKICCATALKHARSIKLMDSSKDVVIVYKDIRLAGKEYEEYYFECERLGVKFIKGEVVKVSKENDGLKLWVKDSVGGELEVNADLVVLSCALTPAKGLDELARKINLSLSPDGFLMELHPKLAPVDTNVDGIFICGACQSPKDISETITQAIAAASRVACLLARGIVEIDLAKAVIDENLCIGCGNCVVKCPYKAIELLSEGYARVIEVACKGCGICVPECPVEAIQLRHYKDEQIEAAVEGALEAI